VISWGRIGGGWFVLGIVGVGSDLLPQGSVLGSTFSLSEEGDVWRVAAVSKEEGEELGVAIGMRVLRG